MKIKKGDNVLVISGKDKGKKGKVIGSFSNKRSVLVEGVNLRKKHVKPKKQGEKGQVVQLPALIDSSNLKVVCSKCQKPSRIGYKIEGKNKYRICKKCKQIL